MCIYIHIYMCVYIYIYIYIHMSRRLFRRPLKDQTHVFGLLCQCRRNIKHIICQRMKPPPFVRLSTRQSCGSASPSAFFSWIRRLHESPQHLLGHFAGKNASLRNSPQNFRKHRADRCQNPASRNSLSPSAGPEPSLFSYIMS